MSTLISSLRRSVRKTFTFQGRDSRSDYRRLFVAWYLGLYGWLGALWVAVQPGTAFFWPAAALGAVGLVLLLPACVTLWTAQVRRLHDLDSSGWWLLLPLVPLVLLFLKGESQANRYGQPPAPELTES